MFRYGLRLYPFGYEWRGEGDEMSKKSKLLDSDGEVLCSLEFQQ